MKRLIINIGRADISEIEKQVNAKLATVKKFSSIKLTQVKLVQFSINDAVEAAKTIDAALEGLDVVSVEPTAIIDMDRLLIVYDAKDTASSNDQKKENDNPTKSTENKD